MPARRIFAFAFVLLSVSLSWPQTANAQDAPPGALPPLKSEAHALKLSVLATGIPIVIGAGFAIFGVSHDSYYDPALGITYETTNHWGAEVGVALAGAGVILGPTLGYIYVGGVGGLPIRVLLPVAGALGGALAGSDCSGGEDCALDAVVIGFGVGTVLAVVDAGYDLARIRGVARKKNEEAQHAELFLVPTYLKSARQLALAVELRF